MTEELKVVMEAIQSLGADGKQAFVWWLVLTRGVTFLGFCMWFCVGLVGVVFVKRLIWRAMENYRMVESARQCEDAAFISELCRCTHTQYPPAEYRKDQIVKWVQTGMKAQP